MREAAPMAAPHADEVGVVVRLRPEVDAGPEFDGRQGGLDDAEVGPVEGLVNDQRHFAPRPRLHVEMAKIGFAAVIEF